MLDPLPDINKAYSTIQRVEKQRQVTRSIEAAPEIVANVTRSHMIEKTERGSNAFVARGVPRNRRDTRKTKSSKDFVLIVKGQATLWISVLSWLDIRIYMKDKRIPPR